MKTKYTYVLLPLLICLFVFSSTAFAQEGSEDGAELLDPEERVEPDDFGTASWAVTFIPASEFQQRGNGTFTYASFGYVYANSGTADWWAPVNIPNGVDIYSVRLYYYRTGGSWTWFLTRYTGTATTQDIDFDTVSSGSGYGSATFDPVHIIDNRFGYVVNAQASAFGSGLRLRGARISWRRFISSGGSQIFDDVSGGPFYSAINNMFRAGITQGCPKSPGFNYCPENVVTRGQMAAFIARSLGLWKGFNTPNP
jgi:hypothetical protein